ncbi:40S ribosomal protein S12 [Daktulosphaira vitifoliae]|uniref:40S ribosomal protein S12 n=1 Tax=Daktulosphaira vitifoliae TaxID=58002 RepID=UPI0021AA019B|nr:40S ribosomal protein S12 [Daktulosphaira vitifoliae]
MSDIEDTVEAGEHGDMYNLLKEVLKNAQVNGSLLHGIHEGAKALEKKLGVLCVLANNCEEAMYKKLVTGLCAENSIPLIEVDSNKTLGEWSGLCKYDNNGQARKVVGCSCVVVKHFGDDTQELDTLLEILKKKNFA